MKAVKTFADFLVSTCVFTACCALGLCIATEQLIIASMPPMFTGLHFVVFGSTLVVYNLSRLAPNPYGKPRPAKWLGKWHYFFFISGILMILWGLPSFPPSALIACGLSGIFALAYFLPALPFGEKKRLRDFGIVKIMVLTAVWVGATAVLPMLYWHVNITAYPLEILLRFIFMFPLCILFDIRDMKADINNNITTLPHKVGEGFAYSLVYISLAVFLALSVGQYIRHPDGRRLLAAVLTAIVTAWVTVYVRRHPGHRYFVAMTDGMMLLYAILVTIPWV